jgi:hypothetical protein
MNGTTSVRFTEQMKGYVSFGESDYERGSRVGCESDTRMMFHLTIEVENLDLFEADREHEAKAAGWNVMPSAAGCRLRGVPSTSSSMRKTPRSSTCSTGFPSGTASAIRSRSRASR